MNSSDSEAAVSSDVDSGEVLTTSLPDSSGLVSDIQDFAVHDGPGLRILVFLKGCPLTCEWCQNPESISPDPEIEYHSVLCRECLRCLDVCPVPGAVTTDKEHRIDRGKCIQCMRCVEVCSGKALSAVGELMSAEQVARKVARYKPFFARSDNGGVTLSGGEPAFQPKFTSRLLELCRDPGIHRAVETCGYTPYETLKDIAKAADLLLYDIKHMDETSHLKGTGKSNTLILENVKRLCDEGITEIVVRIPLINGFNDDENNVRATAEFVSSLKTVDRLDLLPFNELASAKYRAMCLEWKYAETRQQSPEQLARLRKIVESYGFRTTIGGLW